MATIPDDDAPEPTPRERVTKALTAPVTERTPRIVAALAVAAGAGSLAPAPFGIVVAMACVIAASDIARRR